MPRPLKPCSINETAAFSKASGNQTAAIIQMTWDVPMLLTQKEAAAITRKSEKWFERDRWVGCQIPFVKIGRSVRYRAEDIAAYIEANTQGVAQ